MNRLFLDSDILIDLLADREHGTDAAALMAIIAEQKAEACTTPIVLANVDYIVAKHSTRAKSRFSLRTLRRCLSILPLDESLVDEALESDFADFEDAMQYFAAERNGVDFIVTRNKKDFAKGRLAILTAREYLDLHAAGDLIES